MITVLLCAGMGTRMGMTDTPKPLLSVKGISMVRRMILQLIKLETCRTILIVIQQRHQHLFEKDLGTLCQYVHFVFQNEPKGTGDAWNRVVDFITTSSLETDRVLVLNGDTPLVSYELLGRIVHSHPDKHVFTGFRTSNPNGYGRIYREHDTWYIIEEKDCQPEQRDIQLVNAGIYCFLWDPIHDFRLVDQSNAQNEIYMTDMVKEIQKQYSRQMELVVIEEEQAWMLLGANTPKELTILETFV